MGDGNDEREAEDGTGDVETTTAEPTPRLAELTFSPAATGAALRRDSGNRGNTPPLPPGTAPAAAPLRLRPRGSSSSSHRIYPRRPPTPRVPDGGGRGGDNGSPHPPARGPPGPHLRTAAAEGPAGPGTARTTICPVA